jgi:hypothetical protein
MPVSEIQEYLIEETHHDLPRLWEMAESGPANKLERAVAFGFIAHNDEDYTAHIESQALNPEFGYVVQKAILLDRDLDSSGIWRELGIDRDVRGWLAHGFIEFAGDYLVATRLDRTAGRLLYTAAARRSNDFPALLDRSYALGEASLRRHRANFWTEHRRLFDAVCEGESMFRQTMMYYGKIFTGTNRNTVLSGLSAYIYTISRNRNVDLKSANQVAAILNRAVALIQGDFSIEMEGTIHFTQKILSEQKVSY